MTMLVSDQCTTTNSTTAFAAAFVWSNLLTTSSWQETSWTVIMAASLVVYLIISKVLQIGPELLYQIKLWWELWTVPIHDLQVPLPEADPTGRHGDGLLQDSSQPGLIQCYDPSNMQFLGTVPVMTAAQVHDACAKAATAQQSWQLTSFAQRRAVLRTLLRWNVQYMSTIAVVSARDSGKPIVDAILGEVLTTCEKLRCIVQHGERWLQPQRRPTGPLMMHKYARVEYFPLGVIATIAPWNYPYHNAMNHIISGIFAGNAVVAKASEHTSWSVALVTQLVRAALQSHGHNPDLVQTITGFAETGHAVVTNPVVQKIVFTGSPAIGKRVMEAASHHLKDIILELGGKDAMVITEDVPVKQILPWIMRGVFQNCGQNCIGIERVFCYSSLHADLVKAVTTKVQALRQGPPLHTDGTTWNHNIDCGAMVTAFQMDHIETLIQDAVIKGATLVCGGKRRSALSEVDKTVIGGYFFEPTILTDVTSSMRIYHEEVFGPVLVVIQVPKDNDEVCVAMVNDCSFGLGASVFSRNPSRGLAIAKQLRTGMVCVNDFACNYLVQSLPFGGTKQSGFGRFGGPEGLRALCLERSVLTDMIPGIQTTIPNAVQYPITARSVPFSEALIQLFYSDSIMGCIRGILGLIKNG